MTIKLVTAAALACAVALGCGKSTPEAKQPISLVAAADAPAAQGHVSVADGGNGNTAVAVDVKHLAPPQKAHPGATTYVVWAQPPSGIPQSLGAITVDANLQGSLRTVTPLKDFHLFVTPEPSAQAQAPTGPRVLSGHVERD